MSTFSRRAILLLSPFLSVTVSPRAAHALLAERRDEFAGLLSAVGPDRDLVDEAEPFADDSPEWQLMGELRGLPGVGPTIASKLLARKRPRLRPIYGLGGCACDGYAHPAMGTDSPEAACG